MPPLSKVEGRRANSTMYAALLDTAKEMSLRRPYGTPEFICGTRFPHAQARG
jgi:hypothetical protein